MSTVLRSPPFGIVVASDKFNASGTRLNVTIEERGPRMWYLTKSGYTYRTSM